MPETLAQNPKPRAASPVSKVGRILSDPLLLKQQDATRLKGQGGRPPSSPYPLRTHSVLWTFGS